MGVDDVVADAGAQGVERHLLGELGQEREEVVLADRFRGTGRDGDDVDAGADLADFRRIGIGAAGEDVDRQPVLGEVTGKLADVDVHAARVLAAEAGERGGVNRDLCGAAEGHVGLVAEDRRPAIRCDGSTLTAFPSDRTRGSNGSVRANCDQTDRRRPGAGIASIPATSATASAPMWFPCGIDSWDARETPSFQRKSGETQHSVWTRAMQASPLRPRFPVVPFVSRLWG